MSFRDPDRERAMLIDVDRNYLLGNIDYPNRQQDTNREGTIRDRFRGGLQDLMLLEQEGSERLVEKLVPDGRVEQRAMRSHIAGAIALFFELHEMEGWDFEDTLTRGVEEAYQYGVTRGVLPLRTVVGDASLPETSCEPNVVEINHRVREKMEQGERLTDREIRHVVTHADAETISTLSDYLQRQKRQESRKEWTQKLARLKIDSDQPRDN